MKNIVLLVVLLLSNCHAYAQICSDKYVSLEISYIVNKNASEFGDPVLFKGSGVCELNKKGHLVPDEVKLSHQSHVFTGQPFNDRRESTYESIDFVWRIGDD